MQERKPPPDIYVYIYIGKAAANTTHHKQDKRAWI